MNAERFSRIFDVLDILLTAREGLRLTEISQALGAPVSSTHSAGPDGVAQVVAHLQHLGGQYRGPHC